MIDDPNALLIDTNLLLLIIAYNFDSSLIGRRRLDNFTLEQGEFLKEFIADFPRILTTPHILAEVSNLADSCVPKGRHRAFRIFFSKAINRLEEQWTGAAALSQLEAFRRLGLTDAAIVQLANKRTKVITIDLELYQMLVAAEVPAENFNHWWNG